jgi:alkylation response protein AidB-like acyl-CoA dehydrogenase
MDLTLSSEQEAVRTAIRDMLSDRLPMARVRALLMALPSFDEAVWREAAGLGWFGLGLGEDVGGAGYGMAEEMILFTELGRSLVPGPWLGTVLAAHAFAAVDALRETHAAILAGEVRVTVLDDHADALGHEEKLRGSVPAVPDAGLADGFLILGSRRVRYVEATGHARSVRPSMDPTRGLADLAFWGAPAVALGEGAPALRQRATILVAAEAVGVAERALELSVEYAKVRQQFGKPIGSFQAIKHRCADMAVRAEVARSAVTYAAVALDEGEPDAARQVHVAKALAADAARQNATDNVQNHGGMGYTWEADAHLYLKRAWVLEHAFGRRVEHLDALAAPWRA